MCRAANGKPKEVSSYENLPKTAAAGGEQDSPQHGHRSLPRHGARFRHGPAAPRRHGQNRGPSRRSGQVSRANRGVFCSDRAIPRRDCQHAESSRHAGGHRDEKRQRWYPCPTIRAVKSSAEKAALTASPASCTGPTSAAVSASAAQRSSSFTASPRRDRIHPAGSTIPPRGRGRGGGGPADAPKGWGRSGPCLCWSPVPFVPVVERSNAAYLK